MNTDKQHCVISGTSRGLGRALAEHFLGLGYSVAGCSRGDATIDHPDYSHSVVDVRDEAEPAIIMLVCRVI